VFDELFHIRAEDRPELAVMTLKRTRLIFFQHRLTKHSTRFLVRRLDLLLADLQVKFNIEPIAHMSDVLFILAQDHVHDQDVVAVAIPCKCRFVNSVQL
jgi:hypothetical protein